MPESVALRKESVDRNTKKSVGYSAVRLVALRKESVDRNPYLTNYHFTLLLSLSARRAWIEITKWFSNYGRIHNVALRKESVDRNIKSSVK